LFIRKAKPSDKKPILAFCQNTFRWGDYIANVWDSWLSKKGLLAIESKGRPVGICNVSFSKNQVWIEGLRINPKFRRKGYGSKLVLEAESLAKKKKLKTSRMLIAQHNTRSLLLAKSLGYKIEDKWWLYNLRPKKQTTKASSITSTKQTDGLLTSNTYSESWEWLYLDKTILTKLIKKDKVIGYSKNKKMEAIGIWNKSQIDKHVLQIGFLNGTKTGMNAVLRFVQNKGYLQKSKRIQVLAQQKIILRMQDLDRRMLFCLMKKDLQDQL
jgi:GNAT superfamily N-acetyltransferase